MDSIIKRNQLKMKGTTYIKSFSHIYKKILKPKIKGVLCQKRNPSGYAV